MSKIASRIVSRLVAVVVLLLVSLGRAEPGAAAPMFVPLGDLGGGVSGTFNSNANGVSADGSTVVGKGTNASGNPEAFRTTGGAMAGLGDLPGGLFSSFANAASADGTTIVGRGTSSGASPNQAFRWTPVGGIQPLPGPAGGGFFSEARGVSGDGAVVVGPGIGPSGNEAYLWTSAGGTVGLGDLPGGAFGSFANDVSSDGTTVVGRGTSATGLEAMRWTAAAGMAPLGDLPDGGFSSEARGVSADGSVVVGQGVGASGTEAFRWTAAGMTGLGDLPGGNFFSYANEVSGDGATVVGQSASAQGFEAFVWNAATGMRELDAVLAARGAAPSGWFLTEALDVSADGRTIVGFGTNPSGRTEAWLAYDPLAFQTQFQSITLSAGVNVSGTAHGGATTPGGVAFSFADVSAGIFSADLTVLSAGEVLELAAAGEAPFAAIDFRFQPQDPIMPGDPCRYWELRFDGSFAGPLTLSFGYDDATWAAVEGALEVYHFDGTAWAALPVLARDPLGNTITVQTTSLSPFLLGVPVPEPSTGALLALGLGGLAWRRRRVRRAPARRLRARGWPAALVAGLALLATARADATVIAEYDFTGGSLASADGEPNSTAGPLVLSLATTGIAAPGNPAPGLRITFKPTITVSVVLGTLTLTPAPGYALNLESLTFDASLQYESQAGTGQAPFGIGVRSNLDGFASLLGSTSWFASASTPGFAARSIDLSSLQGLTAETLAGVGGSLQLQLLVGGGSILIDPDITTIDNLVVNGTVVPEPGPLALLAVGLGGLALRSNDPARKRGVDIRALSGDTGD